MRFRIWLEDEIDPTIASSEVKRTNLQPQVDADEIDTPAKRDDDKVLAIDASIQRFDSELPGGDSDDFKVKKFKELWDKIKNKWEELKASKEDPKEVQDGGLGDNAGDADYLNQMMAHKNMVPSSPQAPPGPGTFGMG